MADGTNLTPIASAVKPILDRGEATLQACEWMLGHQDLMRRIARRAHARPREVMGPALDVIARILARPASHEYGNDPAQNLDLIEFEVKLETRPSAALDAALAVDLAWANGCSTTPSDRGVGNRSKAPSDGKVTDRTARRWQEKRRAADEAGQMTLHAVGIDVRPEWMPEPRDARDYDPSSNRPIGFPAGVPLPMPRTAGGVA